MTFTTTLQKDAIKIMLLGSGELGKEVAIEGKLTSRSYDDKDGNKRYITEIVCSELLMLGK